MTPPQPRQSVHPTSNPAGSPLLGDITPGPFKSTGGLGNLRRGLGTSSYVGLCGGHCDEKTGWEWYVSGTLGSERGHAPTQAEAWDRVREAQARLSPRTDREA